MTSPIKPQSAGHAPAPMRPVASGIEAPAAEALRFADILKEAAPPSVRQDQGKSSPQQMFEANKPDARAAKRSALQGEYRDALAKGDQQRIDARAAIRSRRGQEASHENSTAIPEPSAPTGQSGPAERMTFESIQASEALTQGSKTNVTPARGAEQLTLPTNDLGRTQPPRSQAAGHVPRTAEPRFAYAAPSTAGPAESGTAAHEVARMLGSKGVAGTERESNPMTTALIRTSDVGSGRFRETAEPQRPVAAPRNTPKSPPNAPAPATNFERLIRAIRAHSGRQSSARVLLDPPELGRVQVRVTVAGDKVEVGVETEHDDARDIIAQRAAKLKSALEEQGLVVERFEVSTNQTGLFERQALAGHETPRLRRDAEGQSGRRSDQERPRNAGSRTRNPVGQTGDAMVVENVNLDVHV